MKILLSLSALIITLTLTAQSNSATWYLNDTSGNGIQSNDNIASGDFSTAMGKNTTASGGASFAIGATTTASGITSFASGTGSTASGTNSVAMGGLSTASGSHSFAHSGTASGTGSIAMVSAIASGEYSTAISLGTIASGDYSTAMGYETRASDYNSFVIGRFNSLSSTVTNSATEFNASSPAFVIGNGYTNAPFVDDGRSDALTVLFDGTTTIAGAVTATAFIGDGSQLTNLSFSSFNNTPFTFGSNTLYPGVQSGTNNASGARSFSTGHLNTSSGDYSTTLGGGNEASGNYSTSAGHLNTSSGDFSTTLGGGNEATQIYSTAIGWESTASGSVSTAMGYFTSASGGTSLATGGFTTASGEYSTAMGYRSIASGVNSFAIGYGTSSEGNATTGTPYYRNEAIGDRSFVIGSRNKSTGIKSFSIGNDNLSQGLGSLAIGKNNISTGDYSMALGLFSESIAKQSFAFGNNAYADGYNTTAIGSANTIDDNAIPDQWDQNNRALVVGNGFYDESAAQLTRSDAFTVWFNGDATLAGNLTINSDARLKANIISLGSTLAKLLQIDGKTYTMKKDVSKKQKIGVLAQDIEKVFPELVSESNGVKSVNYQGLVPVLINALKEQDTKLNKQQAEIDELKAIVNKLITQ